MEGFQKFQPFFQIHRYKNNPRYIYAYTMDSHAAMHWSSGNFPFFQIQCTVLCSPFIEIKYNFSENQKLKLFDEDLVQELISGYFPGYLYW